MLTPHHLLRKRKEMILFYLIHLQSNQNSTKSKARIFSSYLRMKSASFVPHFPLIGRAYFS